MITTSVMQAVQQLQSGHIVAIPTETVYGLAACVSQPAAIQQVFTLKQRPLNHPLIVHVAPDFPIDTLAIDISEEAIRLMQRFWPGPLTLVFRTTSDLVPMTVTGGQTTVAIRCPAHPVTQALLTALQVPVVAPSANPFGKVSPTTAQHVAQGFPEAPLLILDGGRCTLGIESTIVSVSHPGKCQLLRQGALAEASIREVVSLTPYKKPAARVSGQLAQHYQPQKPLYYAETAEILALGIDQLPKPVHVLSLTTPEQVAYEWYHQLHQIDATAAASLLVPLPPAGSEWAGIRDRIMRGGQNVKWFVQKTAATS